MASMVGCTLTGDSDQRVIALGVLEDHLVLQKEPVISGQFR